MHHVLWERAPHWLTDRPSVKFWITFFSIIYSLPTVISSSPCQTKKGLECSQAQNWHESHWSVLFGLHGGVCKMCRPCPWKHTGILPHHVLVASEDSTWEACDPFSLHLVAWPDKSLSCFPLVKWEEQCRWIVTSSNIHFLGICSLAGQEILVHRRDKTLFSKLYVYFCV